MADGTETASRKPYFFVIQSGIISTVLALAGIYWLNKNTDEFNIMGWYANYVIPIGAIIVGAVAGSGYGIASWFTGVRISRLLLLIVVILQAAAYLGAEYVEYRDTLKTLEEKGLVYEKTGELPTFFQYYDLKARTFAWKPKHGKSEGEPMGGWGYVFVLLGAAGFILSGLIAPAVLFAVPYCDSCQRYMSSKTLGVLPASVPIKKISKSDKAAQEAHEKEQADAGTQADEALKRIREAIAAGNVDAFRGELAAGGEPKAANKLPRRVEIGLVWCKACEAGKIVPTVVTGSGDKQTRLKLEATPVSADFVRAVRSPAVTV